MKVVYEFAADLDFYRTASARYARQRPHRHRQMITFASSAFVVACAWIYARASHAAWVLIPQMALICGIAGGTGGFAVAKIMLPIRVKRAPNYGATIAATLDEDGLTAVEPQAQTNLKWAAFTRVAHFSDGILFVRGRVIRWLPDSALQNATPEEAVAFVRTKTNVVDVR
jgi:hypothetical protein